MKEEKGIKCLPSQDPSSEQSQHDDSDGDLVSIIGVEDLKKEIFIHD